MGIINVLYAKKYMLCSVMVCIILSVIVYNILKKESTVKQHSALYYKFVGAKNVDGEQALSPDFGYMPTANVLKSPTVKTPLLAVQIGIEILSSLYGKRISEMQKPYNVALVNDEIWLIEGSLSDEQDFYIMIQMSDCRILSVNGYSYKEYVKSKRNCKNSKLLTFMNVSSYPMICDKGSLFYDYINNDTHIPHSEVEYEFIGNRETNILSFKRQSFWGYVISQSPLSGENEWIRDNGYTPGSSVYNLPNGILVDYNTAAKIGLMILSSIYGEERIREDSPFDITLCDNSWWALKGLKGENSSSIGNGSVWLGIQKSDCRILFYSHERD